MPRKAQAEFAIIAQIDLRHQGHAELEDEWIQLDIFQGTRIVGLQLFALERLFDDLLAQFIQNLFQERLATKALQDNVIGCTSPAEPRDVVIFGDATRHTAQSAVHPFLVYLDRQLDLTVTQVLSCNLQSIPPVKMMLTAITNTPENL